jgi:hypothetical protein
MQPPDNVVLTGLASQALRSEFIGWQCRLRQLAAREEGGRPSPGMRPRVTTEDGEELAASIVTVLVESDPADSTQQFRYQYLQTQDPNERYDRVLEFLQGGYFQDPARFSDVLTALFGPDSALAAHLVSRERCVLEFEQYTQRYRLPCKVARLPVAHAFYQATHWHNRLFNPNLPADAEVLSFTPDWAHAAGVRRETDRGR